MKSERIGNDIKIEWSILREGTPFSLSNKDVSIYLGSQFGRTKISGFTIDSNKVIWTFFGKDQKSLGKYSLVLVINEGNEGMITTDICDFVNLVSCTCEVGGTDNEDVQTETIALTSNLEYVASEYYDDTAIWEYIEKMEKAKADKAEIPIRVSQLENDAEYATVGDLGGKQDKINDLDAIRSGAAKGATALQSIPAEFINESELNNALSPYARKSDIATINGKSIVNGGNIVIEGGGGSGGGSYDDTGIKKDISDLKANDALQDAELAKLSERVGDLEEEKPVFKAIYGETTYDEIKAAYDSGKVVHCDFYNNCYTLVRINDVEVYFNAVQGSYSYYMYCRKKDNAWVVSYNLLEQTSNKTTTLSASSTDTQYPSAKAVYDALQNVGGSGASNEWKCVVDRRLLEGEKNVVFTSYADGTALNAKEVVVQMLCDTTSKKNINGYVTIQSTNNKTRSLYGAIYFESDAATAQNPTLNQIHLKASPVMYVVAEMCNSVKCAVATSSTQQAQGGSHPFQIYEDIVYVEIAPNQTLTSASPYLKIYAR